MRPRQITMAAVLAIVGSSVLVVSLFDTLGRLRTPETREAVDKLLTDGPASELGVSTAQVVDVMRGLAFFSGALAAVALVFAVFVLQRHHAARIGLTVAAALLVLTVPVAGMMPLFVVVAAILVWSRPARDWYAGREPAPSVAGGGTVASEQGPPPSLYPFGGGPSGPPPELPQVPEPTSQPTTQPGSPASQVPYPVAYPAPSYPPSHPGQPYPGQPYPGQAYPGQPYPGPTYPGPDYPGYASGSGRDPDKRPTTVTVAAVLTWLGAGATTVVMLLFVAVLAAGGDAFVEEFDKAAEGTEVNLTADEVMAVGWGIAVFFLLWSLISVVLAVFAFRRSNGARWALVVSAAMTALFSLVAILSMISAVTLLMAGATVILLFTGGANEWYSRRNRDAGPPGGYPFGGYQPPPGVPTTPAFPPTEPPGRNQPW